MAVVTVIIPVLNAMPYLPEALASLEAQIFQDFEVLLWDNGSTDGSVEEARRWIPNRLPGRVVTGSPLPLHECLARMVEEACTELVARMDGDDIALPERFRLQVEFLARRPDVALVGGQIECIDESGASLPKEAWAKYALEHSDIVSRMMVWGPFSHPSIMFRRKAVLDAGNYRVPAPVEDHELYLRLARQHRVANLPDVCTRYRLHSASICAGAKSDSIHSRLALDHTAAFAQEVFGISGETLRRMRDKKHPLCIFPLLASAFYRSRREETSIGSIFGSPDFVAAARCMVADHDIASKVSFRLAEALRSK